MGLVLQTSYNDMTRAEIEEYLEQVRTRRTAAALEYHAGKQLKLTHESERIQRRVKQQYELLGKDLARLETLDEKIQQRMTTIESLRQEIGFIEEQMQ